MRASPNHHWRNVLIIVPSVGTAVATVIFCLRLHARHITVHTLRVEDLLIGVAVLCTYGVAICTIYCVSFPEATGLINVIQFNGHTWNRHMTKKAD